MRIIIVDDNAAMRKVLAALFVSAGHEVVAALADGGGLEEAVRLAAPDVVCLDYQLPGRDGLTLLRSINTLAPQVDVVFMTASNAPDIEERAADAGASGFIRKPFGQTQIIDELRAVAETRRVANAPAPPPRRGPQKTAVIADDSGSIRLVLKGLLEESGLKVVQMVMNGAEAIQAARNHQPGILCLDVNMPVMSGLEALPKILEASPETSIVMVTGSTDKRLVAQAAGLGAAGYIIKPLRPAYVEGYFRKLLGG